MVKGELFREKIPYRADKSVSDVRSRTQTIDNRRVKLEALKLAFGAECNGFV